MRRRLLLVGLIAGLAVMAGWGPIAHAQSVEKIQIADPARRAHGLPAGLLVELSSPGQYNRQSVSGNSGRWIGPRYEEVGNPANGGNASIDWTVTFIERQGDAQSVAMASIQHRDWMRDQREGFSVQHVVGKEVVGTVLGYDVLMRPAVTGDARFEAVLAFPLDVSLWAIVHLDLVEPPSDAFVVTGGFGASAWNRGQALLALSGTQLVGNLPPKIVSARSYQGDRFVKGRVVDRFLDAVIGAPVALERFSGGSWTKVTGGKTNARGFYALRARKRGNYRVRVRMAGFTAMSRTLRAGR